jgi:hypothetical protein
MRAMIVGTSNGVARLSTAADSVPLVFPAPMQTRIGWLEKYVYGSEFWTMTVTPSIVRPSASTRTFGGRIR